MIDHDIHLQEFRESFNIPNIVKKCMINSIVFFFTILHYLLYPYPEHSITVELLRVIESTVVEENKEKEIVLSALVALASPGCQLLDLDLFLLQFLCSSKTGPSRWQAKSIQDESNWSFWRGTPSQLPLSKTLFGHLSCFSYVFNKFDSLDGKGGNYSGTGNLS